MPAAYGCPHCRDGHPFDSNWCDVTGEALAVCEFAVDELDLGLVEQAVIHAEIPIRNAGAGQLLVRPASIAAASWLRPQPGDLRIEAGVTQPLKLEVVRGDLPGEGQSSTEFEVELLSPRDGRTPYAIGRRRITVRASRRAAPRAEIEVAVLRLGAAPGQSAPGLLAVTNAGDAPLTVEPAGASGDWLTVTPRGPLSLAPGAGAEVTVEAAIPASAAKRLEGWIELATSDADRPLVRVQVIVEPYGAPELSLSARHVRLRFGRDAKDSESLVLANVGSAPLVVSAIVSPVDWLSPDPAPPFTLFAGEEVEVAFVAPDSAVEALVGPADIPISLQTNVPGAASTDLVITIVPPDVIAAVDTLPDGCGEFDGMVVEFDDEPLETAGGTESLIVISADDIDDPADTITIGGDEPTPANPLDDSDDAEGLTVEFDSEDW